jgi:hypothetical protein
MSRAVREAWEITDHCCRACLGRVLAMVDCHGRRVYRCAECGLRGIGSHSALCACGQKLLGGKDAGFRCVRNDRVTPEIPAEIVVKHIQEIEGERDNRA